jgi:hypothetical protein
VHQEQIKTLFSLLGTYLKRQTILSEIRMPYE